MSHSASTVAVATPAHLIGKDRRADLVLPPLNPMDSIMLAVNETLQTLGIPGFNTQAFVWLEDRVDVDRLRRAVAALGRRYPKLTARLQTTGLRRPQWCPQPDGRCELQIMALSDAADEAVFAHAARLLAGPQDLSTSNSIQFHLLERPDGRELFLMQYNHLLMDNTAAVLVLQELARLAEGDAASAAVAVAETDDRMTEYLGRFSRRQKLRAAGRVLDLRFRQLRFQPRRLAAANGSLPQPLQIGMAVRRIDRRDSTALQSRVLEICRFPGLSMAVLASMFRTLRSMTPAGEGDAGKYIIGLGLDLGLRDETGPLFQNLVSLVAVGAAERELHDRDALIRSLNTQLRERLQGQFDLGLLELARHVRRVPPLFRRLARHILQDSYSLWYAWFGAQDAVGTSFCGARISHVSYAGPCWPPLGFTLLASQFDGETFLHATWLPALVPDATAHAFLDRLVAELQDLGRRPPS